MADPEKEEEGVATAGEEAIRNLKVRRIERRGRPVDIRFLFAFKNSAPASKDCQAKREKPCAAGFSAGSKFRLGGRISYSRAHHEDVAAKMQIDRRKNHKIQKLREMGGQRILGAVVIGLTPFCFSRDPRRGKR